MGRNVSAPDIVAPVPRRATSGSILAPTSSPDSVQYDSRRPLPNTPLHASTPSVLNQQLPLNGIPNAHNEPSTGGNAYTPRLGHARTDSGSSAKSNLSTSSRKSARFSPNLTVELPEHIHNPPPRGVTPIRSAMRQTPSPARSSSQYRFPAPSSDTDPVPNIRIVHPTPPSPTSPGFVPHQPPVQPPNWAANAGGGGANESDDDPTPGQSAFRSSSRPNLRKGTPSVQRQSPGGWLDDSGYFSPHHSVLAKSPVHPSITQSQQQPQGTSNTSSDPNQSRPASSSSQVNRSASQQRSNKSRAHTSWQPPRTLDTYSPAIPSFSRSPGNVSHNSANPIPPMEPVRPPYATHTPARPAHRSTHRDLSQIYTSFDHPVAGQFDARPRSSQTQSSQHTPYGPTRTVLTPANEGGNADVDVNSVVTNLLRVTPSSVAWQTPRGVLTWTPHPGLPDSGSNLLGGGRGSGGSAGGRVGNPDCWTGGYPMPGACSTWTPGAWPPTSASSPTRRAPIQLAPWMIPNPSNAALPHIMWDISQLPTSAKRITGNHVITSVTEKLDDIATYPSVDRLVVVCQVGVAQNLWGHIDVRASGPKGVTVWDVFNSIFGYFQKRVGRRELDRMKEMAGDEQLEEKMAGAFYQRVLITPALPGYELKKGLKRVDCLGDASFFWGLYVSYNDDNTWQLNLGLVNRRRYA
jgi:hypothetical protein